MKSVDEILDGLLEKSKELEASGGRMSVDERNELVCLKLFEDGWIQDGFDYISGTQDVIVYWKKDGKDRKSIHLIPAQQRRWIRELERRQKEMR